MRSIKFVQIIILLITLYGGTVQAVQQAFLIQNSGWMEPFYLDEKSEFKPLIIAMVEAVADADKPVTILTFNQTTPENESPKIIYQSKVGTSLRKEVNNINLARKGVGQALADTDFNEAVRKTIAGPFKNMPGIIWIFTNNKNSPNNSPETAAHNRHFYNLVHTDPSITRSLAFSFAMPVKGHRYTANGLMVYALAYGAEADVHLQSLISNQKLKGIVRNQPAQLKPLDKDAVKMIPKSIINAANTSTSLGADGRTVILDIDVSSKQQIVKVVSKLENCFYPYRIVSANISAQLLRGKDWENNLAVFPKTVENLAPGGASDFTAFIPMQTEFPKIWSFVSLFDFGRQIRIPATIHIRLENQQLGIDDTFRIRHKELFPGDPLPDVFVPPTSVRTSNVAIPLIIRVNYPLWPLLIVIGSIIALLIVGIFLISRIRFGRYYEIVVDGLTRRITLGLFARQIILDDAGQQIGIVRRRFGTPIVESVSSGHTLSLRT